MIDKIIEELETEISKQEKNCNSYGIPRICAYKKAIKIVKQVAEEGGWIKCSDRLPEKSDEYLITYKWLGCYYTKYANFEKLKTKGKWKTKENVIAWQPLPKPYKEAENGD